MIFSGEIRGIAGSSVFILPGTVPVLMPAVSVTVLTAGAVHQEVGTARLCDPVVAAPGALHPRGIGIQVVRNAPCCFGSEMLRVAASFGGSRFFSGSICDMLGVVMRSPVRGAEILKAWAQRWPCMEVFSLTILSKPSGRMP